MPTYEVEFNTHISLIVTVEADDADSAAELAHPIGEGYLQTVYGNSRNVRADATLDGIGADGAELKAALGDEGPAAGEDA